MKVLIADKVPAWFSNSLQEAGCTVHVDPTLDGPTLTEAVRAHDPEVVREVRHEAREDRRERFDHVVGMLDRRKVLLELPEEVLVVHEPSGERGGRPR